jgi:Fic family protein
MADLGITWDPFDVSLLQPSSVDRVRHRFRSQFPEIIWNTAALEGNTFTLPEVRTLLDGVAVGGKRMADEQQVLALSDAYNRLDEMIGSGEFRLDKSISDELHSLVAVHEAIESGHFRGEGQVTGGGSVRLSSGGVVPGIEHGDGGRDLLQHYRTMVEALERVDDPRRRAFLYFAAATRRQFYFDGNKRTARLMMSGTLLSHGFDAVNVTYARRLEFNEALDAMFTTDDATALLRFFGTC